MTVAQTSIENYRAHRDTGRMARQTQQVFDGIAASRTDCSRGELAEKLGLRLSSVCGRVNELLARGLIEEAGVRPCRVTGKTVRPVRLACVI